MAVVVFSPCLFRKSYPQFSNAATYPDDLLQGYFDTATIWLSKELDVNNFLNEARLTLALNLLTAHLAALSAIIASGNKGGIVTSATIDDISVTLEPPPVKNNQFAWWINQTPYGAQFSALLTMATAGGTYIGKRNEIGSFRRSGGY